MATLISKASGNWTTVATWAKSEAGSGAAALTLTTNVNNTSTSYQASIAFTCTASDVIDGVFLFCRRLNTTGTVTVGLSDDNGSTYAREVTVNAADLPLARGWVFFKFATPLTADGGSDYKVAFKSSSANNAAFHRASGTTGDYMRLLRLTADAAAAPTNGDIMFVTGELTGTGASTALTVTYDQTSASPDFGGLYICPAGKLAFGTAASTAYELKLSAILWIYELGELTIGTTSSRIPSTSTAEVIFDCGTTGEFGMVIRGTFRAHGAVLGEPWAKLASSASPGATSLTLDRSVAWKSGDTIVIPDCSGDINKWEERVLNGDASGASVSLTAALTNAHSIVPGGSVRVGHYNRNVKIRGASASLYSWVSDNYEIGAAITGTVVEMSWCQLYWLGTNQDGRRGFTIFNCGTIDVTYCSFHHFSFVNGAYWLLGSDNATGQNATVKYNVIANGYKGNVNGPLITGFAATNGTVDWQYNLFISFGTVTLDFFDKGTFKFNAIYNTNFVNFRMDGVDQTGVLIVEDNEFNSNGSIYQGTDAKFLRHTRSAFINNTFKLQTAIQYLDMRSCIFKHTAGSGIEISGLTLTYGQFISCEFEGQGSNACIWSNGANYFFNPLKFVKCSFTGADYLLKFYFTIDHDFSFENCTDDGMTKVYSAQGTYGLENDRTGLMQRVRFTGHNSTDYEVHTKSGYIQRDAVIYESPASSSERMVFITTIAARAMPLRSAVVRKFIGSGVTPTISVRVRKSTLSDSGGSDYNGSQPKLVLHMSGQANVVTDISSEASSSLGLWETLTVSGLSAASADCFIEAHVEIIGDGSTVGWVNVGEWS